MPETPNPPVPVGPVPPWPAAPGLSIGSDAFGGAGPRSMELTPWDFWSQTRDPALDGDPGSGNNAQNDCGPESLAMCAAHLAGVVLDADYIKDAILGKDYVGYTSLDNLQTWLRKYLRTDSDVVFPNDKNSWLYYSWKALTLAHPLIGLFSFSAPGATDGHFRPIIGMASDHTLITADPANGTRRVESWQVAWNWAKGPLIHIKRRRSILV